MNSSIHSNHAPDRIAAMPSRRLHAILIPFVVFAVLIGAATAFYVFGNLVAYAAFQAGLNGRPPTEAESGALSNIALVLFSVPFVLAGVVTVLLVIAYKRANRHVAVTCALISSTGMIVVSLAVLASILSVNSILSDGRMWPSLAHIVSAASGLGQDNLDAPRRESCS